MLQIQEKVQYNRKRVCEDHLCYKQNWSIIWMGKSLLSETEHNTIVWVKNNAVNNPRCMRLSLTLQQFNYSFRNYLGKYIHHVGCLSRADQWLKKNLCKILYVSYNKFYNFCILLSLTQCLRKLKNIGSYV